jgi:hypothetical protein
MATKNILYFTLILTSFLFLSCDEIDESPAEVNMEILFEGDVDNNLQFSTLNLNIDEITLEANKENGETFIFTEDLNQENLSLSDGVIENLFKFNLPPAIYNKITIQISLRENQDANSLVFSGSLRSMNPMQNNLPILFEQRGRELIELKIKSTSGNSNEIVIQRGEKINAMISIDASYIFQTINPGLLIAANNLPIAGISTVLINRGNNPDIYNLVSNRINQSFSAKF